MNFFSFRQLQYSLLLLLLNSLASIGWAQSSISFGSSSLTGSSSELCTSLDFGPDNRLYVAQQNGIIKAYTILRFGPNNYVVTNTETITAVNEIPNHNDDGQVNPSVTVRQITGIMLKGTATNPVIWVTSSDPRIGAGPLGTDTGLDTNSGIVSRLTWTGSAWVREDIVRGLPRSEENHSLNGLVMDDANNMLYVCAGGNTNKGARSNNFALLSEFAYAAAVLSIDLNAISSFPYDLPTLDDEDRPGVNDFNDPFGGNDGKNQAMLEVGGPVQVHSPGFRNPYDIVLTENGRLYSWDNGPNSGWGDAPLGCDNDLAVEGGATLQDGLHFIPSAGYYAGHPNPVRGDRSNTFNVTNPQSPIPAGMENPVECTFLAPLTGNDAIVLHPASTNGLTEYTATNFEGSMKGNLLAATFDGQIVRVELNEAGDALAGSGKTSLFSGFGSVPLDVIALGDSAPFPGTVWVGNIFGATDIQVFEPADYEGGIVPPCDFSDPDGDGDGDGYTNADELLNATDPCSAASKPRDWDGDGISDLLDPDDDNDGIPDVSDILALDADNGSTTFMPIDYDWEPGDPSRGGFFDLGFYGMMNNGNSDYLNQYELSDITAGGTAGLFTIDNMTEGTSFGVLNTQENSFQFGVNMDTVTRPFVLQSRIRSPFSGLVPGGFNNMGMFFGTGDMDNYIKLVVHANGGAGGIEYLQEIGGVVSAFPITQVYPAAVLGSTFVDLYLTIDPLAGTVQPSYSINGSFPTTLGDPRSFPLSWVEEVLIAGITGSSAGPGEPFPATWDYIKMKPLGPQPAATLNVFAGNFLTSDVVNDGSFQLTNTSVNGGNISQVVIDLTSTLQPRMVFDPEGLAADNAFKDLTPNAGDSATGFAGHVFEGFRDGGYDRLVLNFTDFEPGETFTFSVDIDPLSIKGLNFPGPRESAKVCGLELTGAQVAINFDSGDEIAGQLFMTQSSFGGSSNRFDEDTIAVPVLEFLGDLTSASVTNTSLQTVRIHGLPGSTVRMIQAEGGMFLGSNPGFELLPFESNTLIKRTEFIRTVGLSGFVDVVVTLERNEPESGLTHFVAVTDVGVKTSNLSNQLVVQYEVPPITPGGQTVVNLNCGGPAYTANDGTIYTADQYFSGSSTYINNTIPDILGTNDDVIYRTERTASNFNYTIPLDTGDYEVVLHFAEIFFGAAGGGAGGSGKRIFDVSMEGVKVIDDLDLFDSVSHSTALVMTFPSIAVNDGILNLQFQASVNQAKISAIQVRPAAVEPEPCAIDSVVLDLTSACDPGTNTYSQSLIVFSSQTPLSGSLEVNGQLFAVETSPQVVVLDNLIADGAPVDLDVRFSEDTLCSFSLPAAWTAPVDCTPVPPCSEAPVILSVVPTANSMTVSWEAIPTADGYQLSGRKVGAPFFAAIFTSSTSRTVGGLESGTNYEFRLRARCDGTVISPFTELNFFSTLNLREAETGLFSASLSPNPAVDFTRLAINSSSEGMAYIAIHDLSGRLLKQQQIYLGKGQSVLDLEIGNLHSGIYLVEIRQGDRMDNQRLEIIR